MKQFTEIDDFIKSTQDKCYMLILCCIIFVILIVYLLRKYRNFNALLASFQDTVNQNSYRVIKYNETNLLLLQDLKKMNQKILHQNDNQEKLEIKLKQAKNDNILLNDQILNKNKKLEIQDNNLSVYNSTIKMLEKNQEKIEHEMLLKIQDLNSNELNYKSMEQDNYRLKQVNETMATELSEFKKQEKLLQSQIDFHQTEWDILNEAIQYSESKYFRLNSSKIFAISSYIVRPLVLFKDRKAISLPILLTFREEVFVIIDATADYFAEIVSN
ncbi:hypothetical protein A3Q56_03803 [Intoshia linei]|uniref:Uncharacterized protein n=1 Tax=Intoshia linei TaxID=1819745 RepID=A0A177B2T0_9BILA|nr:hypothetical protein A3Q56_03803 [Intoshia linei]